MAVGSISLDISEFGLELDANAIKQLGGSQDVTTALILIGQAGEASAKSHAPVDTGNLRRSITHELGDRDGVQYVRIGTNVRYAIYQELGTRFHPANPFLRPALEDLRGLVKG
jgi:HK97 gp10 family phage protein